MLGGRTNVPSVLAVVGPGTDVLMLLFENDVLSSQRGHRRMIKVKITKELVVGRQLRVDYGCSEHVEGDSLGDEVTP